MLRRGGNLRAGLSVGSTIGLLFDAIALGRGVYVVVNVQTLCCVPSMVETTSTVVKGIGKNDVTTAVKGTAVSTPSTVIVLDITEVTFL